MKKKKQKANLIAEKSTAARTTLNTEQLAANVKMAINKLHAARWSSKLEIKKQFYICNRIYLQTLDDLFESCAHGE